MIVPALPPAAGRAPAKARFFGEAAVAFELLALWHSLPIEAQRALLEAIQTAAAAAGEAELAERAAEVRRSR